ncbi:MAG: hypothetical protein IKG89_02640 [Oscillospiraceae bacterium]|nr:hypothetical protein [Oscillospiraceae bacterium]
MRPDGIKVKEADPMYFLIPYFLTRRYDAMNMITVDVPEEPMRLYMNQKRREGRPVSHLALVITAYLRVLDEYPALNRFVGNKTIYEHKDKTVSMVVLRPNGEDAMSKIYLEATDDVFSIQEKITSYISENRSVEEQNLLDKWMARIVRMKLLMSIFLALVRFMDRHGLLPMALVKASPFHASLLISNLASIRTNHIYHHIYDFGTTSLAITMGNMHEIPRRTKDGIVFDRCLPLGIVMDERIATGHYFALAFNRFRQYLAKPEQLERPARRAEGKAEAAAAAD